MRGTTITRNRLPVNQLSHRDIRVSLLTIGFIAFSTGVLFAWNTPATGYEVSIYQSTPLLFWIGTAVAFGAAAIVCAIDPRDHLTTVGVSLGWLTTVAVGSLPLLRGYRFYGLSDSMTHLGWAEDLRIGFLGFFELFYPGGHSSTVLIAEALGLTTMRGMVLFVTILIGLHALFIPLVARALFGSPRATVIVAFSGFMLLSFNNVSTRLMFHTYSLGVLLFPLFLYVLVRYLTSEPNDRSWIERLGGWNITLVITGVYLLFTHPQVKLNVLILLGTIVVVRLLYTIRNASHRMVDLRPLSGAFLLLSAVWLVWTTGHWYMFAVAERVAGSVYGLLLGTEAVAETVGESGDSASVIGASLGELFVKLFLVPAVYSVLALGAVVLAFRISTSTSQARSQSVVTETQAQGQSVVTYFGYGGLVLGAFFLLHFVGPVSELFFRHLGFGMVFVTILGGIGIHYLGEVVQTKRRVMTVVRPVAIGLLGVALVLSLLVAFPSPYIYHASHHVTDQHVSGYGTAIEHSADGIQWDGIRSGPGREFDALTPDERPDRAGGVSTENDTDLRSLLSGEAGEVRYLPVSAVDVDREVTAYQELRYSRAALESIGSQPSVHHVQDNGEFDLFYVSEHVESSNDQTGEEDS